MTHPFHPLYGRKFDLLEHKKAWGEDRVYYRDAEGRLHHMPVGWTSVGAPDRVKKIAAGKCRFVADDLLQLADLVARLAPRPKRKRKANNAANVMEITPQASPAKASTGRLGKQQRPKRSRT